MRILTIAAAFVLFPLLAFAAESFPWAYPTPPPPGIAPSAADRALVRVPGSAKAYTPAQIENAFSAVDWFPAEHPPMPAIVQYGNRPTVRACAFCHLANGLGHPESASLAGLPTKYIVQQISAYKNGTRIGFSASMASIAKGLSDRETRQAAGWFSRLPRRPWVRVAETKDVAKTVVLNGNLRVPAPGTATEPLANRIIELPLNVARTKNRDPHSGTVAYVPMGSIARGKLLVTTGAGVTIECAACHGAALQGIVDVPSISGRSPIYIFRQLNDIRSGRRRGPDVGSMRGVVARMTTNDMIAIAAYLASRQP
ncbi:MAG TPA: c-type cytochrome [Candidatus Lustribacter sp.]|jgi:cytochrome c553|nr:c-type cytochrome [Candidatus Lustribacter sp.]